MCLGLNLPFGKTHVSERARQIPAMDVVVLRARTRHVETDGKGHLTMTSKNEMDVKNYE